MRWKFLPGLALLLAGCVASSDVKIASSEVGAALSALDGAEGDFRGTFLRELEETRQLVGRSVVANAVVHKVRSLAEAEKAGNLLQISEEIKNERDAARQRVDRILGLAAPKGTVTQELDQKGYERVVENELLSYLGSGLSTAAKEAEMAAEEAEERARRLDTETARAEAKKLREMAAGFREIEVRGALAEISHKEIQDLSVIVRLEATKGAIRADLDDLRTYIGFLQDIHKQINAWISTDVKVDGAKIGKLIDDNSSVLGLGPGGGQP